MIQIHEVNVPLEGADGEAAVATLSAQMDKLKGFYPALRSASVAASGDVLTMQMRVAGRTRWHISYSARRIASSMLRRVKLDPAKATMTLCETAAVASSLTKEQGRNTTGQRARVRSDTACEDPS